MKKLDYRNELELDLMDCTIICRSSRGVYLAGTNDKTKQIHKAKHKPIRKDKASRRQIVLEIRPFLADKKLSEQEAKAKKQKMTLKRELKKLKCQIKKLRR